MLRLGLFKYAELIEQDELRRETSKDGSKDVPLGAGEDRVSDPGSVDSGKSVDGKKKIIVIKPHHPLKVRWDLLIGLIIVWTVIVTPYRIGFGVEMENLSRNQFLRRGTT